MDRTRPLYEEIICAGLGAMMAGAANLATKRPLFSRIYIYPIAATLGFGAGRVLSDINEKRLADRELALWDYVHRHPDDFPEITPKKYKEVLEPWHPIR